MFLVAFVFLALATVPMLGGDVSRLADIRLRNPWLLGAALSIQILVISFIEGSNPTALAALHLASYAMLGVFLVRNLKVAGLPVIGVGWSMNTLVITANGGVMPAASAGPVAGSPGAEVDVFLNSRPLAEARLGFLGDNFALPEWLPLHNVFSVGDVFIALGAFIAFHWICRSVIPRAADGLVKAGKIRLAA